MRAFGPSPRRSHQPATSAAVPDEDEEEGDHPAMIAVTGRAAAITGPGNAVARRNLLDAWTLMSSPPLASLGPFGLPSTLLARRVRGSMGLSTYFARIVHGRCSCPPVIHRDAARPGGVSQALRPVSGSIARTCPSKLVSTSRPPTSSASVTTSECATRHATSPSRSSANVSTSAWTRTWGSRDDPRTTSTATPPVAPAQFPGPRLERVDVEPVLEDEQALGVPQQARRARR